MPARRLRCVGPRLSEILQVPCLEIESALRAPPKRENNCFCLHAYDRALSSQDKLFNDGIPLLKKITMNCALGRRKGFTNRLLATSWDKEKLM